MSETGSDRHSEAQPSGIELKLTYNQNKYVPRNFFIHLYNVPLDAAVQIAYDGQDVSMTTDGQGYYDARFRVEPDTAVSIIISQNGSPIASGKYLIHEEKIFTEVFNNNQLDLIQLAYGTSF